MSGILVLVIQAVAFLVILGTAFFKRKTVGIGAFFCLLGTMHVLEGFLGTAFVVELPHGLISPGATAMFAGKLAFFLLLYIKEDAEAIRPPTYGLLGGNLLVIVLAGVLRIYGDSTSLLGSIPDHTVLDQAGLFMMWGTILLLIDVVLLVLLYEGLGSLVTNTLLGRMFITTTIVLSVDQFLFYAGVRLLVPVSLPVFLGGWLAKVAAAAFFSLMLSLYLRFVEHDVLRVPTRSAGDVFDRMTYRHRYEKLVEQIGMDALTGLQGRGQFDAKGPAMVRAAAESSLSVSLIMIDIDHFKAINDKYGHVEGDRVIRDVAAAIASAKRDGDELFRYGGEEFALLCLETDAGAMALAERLRAAVADLHQPLLERPITISAGVATCPRDATCFDDLLLMADAALYEAKALGRNCAVYTGAPGPGSHA